MVAIKKRRKSSLGAIPKPIKLSLKPVKKGIDILPPPPPPGIKTKKAKISIPKPLETKKSFDIPLPLHEAGYEELPPPPPYIPFDIIRPKKDRLLEKELKFNEKKNQRKLEKERELKKLEEKKQLKLEIKKREEETPKPKGFLKDLFGKKEEPFIDKERKRLEKLREKELEKKKKIGGVKLDQEKELEKKTKELKVPGFEELPDLPDLEGLPELEDLPPIGEEVEEKKEIKPPRQNLFSIKKLFPKKLQQKEIEPEMEEPPAPEETTGELEIPELEEKEPKEKAIREIAEAIEHLKSRKPIKYEFKEKPEGDVIDSINQMINEARDALLNLNIRKAKYDYIKIMKIYNSLDDYKKSKVYEAIRELYEERKSAEAMLNK